MAEEENGNFDLAETATLQGGICLDGNWRQLYFLVLGESYYARDGACLNGIGLQLSRGVRLCFAH